MTIEKYKKLSRLYLPEAVFGVDGECDLLEGQVHYLRNVMRKQVGDKLRVFNGRDGEWLARIEKITKNNGVISFVERLLQQESGSDVCILASPVKKDAFNLMIQKSCELGAACFIPVICDHTVVHKINRERLQSIAIEAAEQSERLDVMEILEPIKLKTGLPEVIHNKKMIFCLERSNTESFLSVLHKIKNDRKLILIGPEGGFSEQEIDYISSFDNTYTVSLGETVLKTETALIAALSCVQIFSKSC